MDQRAYTVAELVELGLTYMRATGITPTRMSLLTVGHNRFYERLLEGWDCRTQAAEKASDWFDQNWPRQVGWPPGVPRRGRAIAA